MYSKIIIGFCLVALLTFSLVLAQTNNSNRSINSNISTDSSQSSNSSNANKKNFPFNVPEESRNIPHRIRSTVCQYLTEADAQNLTDKSVLFYTSSTYGNSLHCLYTGQNSYFLPSVGINLETFPREKQAQAEYQLKIKSWKSENRKHPQIKAEFRTVSDIGDTATIITASGNLADIYCRKNKTEFEISVLDFKDKVISIHLLEAIARKVTENISTANGHEQ